MGNRAVITTQENFDKNGVGVYLHWNGGRDSIEGFLKYMQLKGYRTPETDCYGWARLCQVIGNFFGGTTSLGIDVVRHLDTNNHDNGVYIIKGWEISDRKYHSGVEQHTHKLDDMLLTIDKAQPESEQLGEDFLKAPIMDTAVLQIGDMVYIQNYDGRYETYKILGFGDELAVNGADVLDVPFVGLYGEPEYYRRNINNYLFEKEYRVFKERSA